MTRRAFYFDASACSGCKACQVACKDRSGLGPGVLWRRVYEVTGGGWTQRGAAWQHDVVAYNLSVACNHCDRPICMEVCPTGAITQRGDGIVLLDGERCMGCRYCAWACPYDALQFDADAGRMSKCDFCVDELDRGRDPACVAACPLRVLEVGDRDELAERYGPALVAPLPDHALTRPALFVTPHPAGEASRSAAAAETARFPGHAEAADGARFPGHAEAADGAAGPGHGEHASAHASATADRALRVANREEVSP